MEMPKVIVLSSNGNNSPPASYGSFGEAHIVGSSPTAGTAYVGHAGELALNNGQGGGKYGTSEGYDFVGKSAMKDLQFMFGGTAYTYSGSALVALGVVDTETSALATVTSAADKVPYFTGDGTADVFTCTAAARTVLDDTTVGAMCATLGVMHSVTFLLAQGADSTTGADKTSHVIMPFAGAFVKAWATAKTGPTTSALLFDINKNGTTVFTNQAHRLTIAAAATTGNTTSFDVTTFAAGDEMSIDIDQIGSGTAGKDITVVLSVTQS